MTAEQKEDRKAYLKARYQRKRDAILTYRRDWREKNKGRVNEQLRTRRKNKPRKPLTAEGKARVRANGTRWYRENLERSKKYQAEYYRNHPRVLTQEQKDRRKELEAVRIVARRADPVWKAKEKARHSTDTAKARRRQIHQVRQASDIQYVLRGRISKRILAALSRGLKKAGPTTELLGCDIPTLRAHLEALFLPGMTWENRRLWHVDHIRPCASFNLLDPEQQRCCFHYTNLQPLWAPDNIRKSDKILA
jgi:hypothetical protein